MTHAWYLPCDFHYFIIAIGVCILIKKDKKIGLSALLTTTIISMVRRLEVRISSEISIKSFYIGDSIHFDRGISSAIHVDVLPGFLDRTQVAR